MANKTQEAVRIIRRLVRAFWGEMGTGVSYGQNRPLRCLRDAKAFLKNHDKRARRTEK